MKQMSHMSKSNAFSGIDGYDWAKRSLPGLQDKLAAEYALGLMQAETSWPNEHIRRAVLGAQEGSLLAQNLMKHYQNQSLAEVKQTLAVKSASRRNLPPPSSPSRPPRILPAFCLCRGLSR